MGLCDLAKMLGGTYAERLLKAKEYRPSHNMFMLLLALLEIALPPDTVEDLKADEYVPTDTVVVDGDDLTDGDEAEDEDGSGGDSVGSGGDSDDGNDSECATGRGENGGADDAGGESGSSSDEEAVAAAAEEPITIPPFPPVEPGTLLAKQLAALKAGRRGLRDWVALVVGIERGNGDLQLRALRALGPLLAATNRTNYTILTAKHFHWFLSPEADMARRRFLELVPGCRLTDAGVCHAYDGILEHWIGIVKKQLNLSVLNNHEHILRQIAQAQPEMELIEQQLGTLYGKAQRRSGGARSRHDKYVRQLFKAVAELRQSFADGAVLPNAPGMQDEGVLDDVLSLYRRGTERMIQKLRQVRHINDLAVQRTQQAAAGAAGPQPAQGRGTRARKAPAPVVAAPAAGPPGPGPAPAPAPPAAPQPLPPREDGRTRRTAATKAASHIREAVQAGEV